MKTWQEIEEEFKDRFRFGIVDSDEMIDILAFFKPYFQEKLHQEAKEELESTNYVQHAKNCSIYRGVLESEGLKCDCKYNNAKPESSWEKLHEDMKPIFTVRDENGKEVASLFDNGMASVSKFGYSANTYYESAKSKVEKEAYERGFRDGIGVSSR